MNDNFSFVRFLKVVKTLYESSTFTQLGRTVGSALGPLHQSPSNANNKDNKDDDSRKSGLDNKASVRTGDSIFDALAEACNGVSNRRTSVGSGKKYDGTDGGKKDTLFEQVIKGCTLLSSPHGEEFSDEDTFKTRTEEDLSYYSEGESFETDTYDQSTAASQRHRSSRKSSKGRRRR
jgi:hypothetical protein